VELEEGARREVEDRAIPHFVLLRVRREWRELSSRPVVARCDARRTGEHVHRLRERNGGDEAERGDAVHPPLDEVRVSGRASGETEPAEGLSNRPTERRPDLERRVRLGNTERLQQESRQGEEEEDAKESPVTDHVETPPVLTFGPVRAPVTQPKRPLNSALVGHDRQPDNQGGTEDVEKERVPLVELVSEEVPAQDRLGEVTLEAEDDRPGEQDEEAVEDEEVPRTRYRVTPLDPRVREDDGRGAPETPERLVDGQRPASAAVLEDESHDAPGEDRRGDGDQAIPEDDLPCREAGERRAGRRQVSFSSSSATSKRSATAPKWATLKIAASGSVLTAMIVPLVFMPA